MSDLGKLLMLLGVLVFLAGAAFAFAGRVPWIGRLPGDVVIEGHRFRIFFPLGTCILVSLLLTLLFWVLRR
jgi:Protein of unknown function (DUF2905)